MMLFKLENFLPEKEKFTINIKYDNTWELYTNQYQKVVSILNEKGLNGYLRLNSISYAYLFLLRHYSELKLKSIIHARGNSVPLTHDFGEIKSLLSDIPDDLVKAISLIDLDKDGSCYRYLYDKNGEVNVLSENKKDFKSFYKYISSISQESDFRMELGVEPFLNSVNLDELTFYLYEVNYPGILRTHYDQITVFFIEEITKDKININEVFLPIFFSIRHSIELVLKDSLTNMLHTTNVEKREKIKKLINNEHKLSQLFTNYIKLIPVERISELPLEISSKYDNYLAETTSLKNMLHILDSNSRYFRYPYDSAFEPINLKKDSLINIITIFLKIDSFLTFNIDILKRYNLITYTDKELEDMFGI